MEKRQCYTTLATSDHQMICYILNSIVEICKIQKGHFKNYLADFVIKYYKNLPYFNLNFTALVSTSLTDLYSRNLYINLNKWGGSNSNSAHNPNPNLNLHIVLYNNSCEFYKFASEHRDYQMSFFSLKNVHILFYLQNPSSCTI